MLLDALLAAEDRLIITYSGNDERTNAALPPAVPVGELLDAVDLTAQDGDGRARDRIVVRHPLQPFDPANFVAGELVPGVAWGFDRTALDGARALTGARADPPPFLPAPLPPAGVSRLTLEELVAFAERPIRAFMRQRLGITVSDSQDELRDGLPVHLEGLDLWQIGQRVLDGVLAGVDPNACLRAEIARGALPPGQLGRPVIHRIWPTVEVIAAAAKALADAEPRSIAVNVSLDGAGTLTGSVSGVRGTVLLTASYSRVNPRHRMAAWVRLLALTAADPEQPWEAVTVGKAPYGTEADLRIARIAPLTDDPQGRRARALAELERLVELRHRGLREVLPIPPATAAAYAEAATYGRDPVAAAGKAWTSGFKFDGEDVDPDHVRAFGGCRPLAALLEPLAGPNEHGEGWDDEEPTRFGRYALRLWHGLLRAEAVEDR